MNPKASSPLNSVVDAPRLSFLLSAFRVIVLTQFQISLTHFQATHEAKSCCRRVKTIRNPEASVRYPESLRRAVKRRNLHV